jgi:hypothetical protein
MIKKWIFVLLGLFLSLNTWAQTVTLPQVEVTGLRPFLNQYLTVYFALGTPASIALSPEQISLREVRAKTTISIENQSSVTTPRMTVAIQGFTVPFNVLLIVIHQGKKFSWKNANGTLPLGEDNEGSSKALLIRAYLKPDIEALTSDGVIRIAL